MKADKISRFPWVMQMWFCDNNILSLRGNLFSVIASQQDLPQPDFTLTMVTAWDPTARFLGLYENKSKKEIVDLSKMGRQLCFPSVCTGIRLGTGSLGTRKVGSHQVCIHPCHITVLLELWGLNKILAKGESHTKWQDLIRTHIAVNIYKTVFWRFAHFKFGEKLWILEYREASCGGCNNFGNLTSEEKVG